MRHPHGEDFWGILLLGKMRTTLRGVEPSVVKLLGALYEPKTAVHPSLEETHVELSTVEELQPTGLQVGTCPPPRRHVAAGSAPSRSSQGQS